MRHAQTTREQILDYLSTHASASAAEIAAVLGVTAANIRHHLGLLQSQGLVVLASTRRGPRRGRPVKLYRLTSAAQQAYLEPLTRALLDALRDQKEGNTPEQVLCEVFCREIASADHRSLRARLQSAMHHLKTLHYEPRWEAHHDGPRVTFHRCPYAQLVEDYPELCRLDTLMLERLLNAKVTRRERRGGLCEFVVHSR